MNDDIFLQRVTASGAIAPGWPVDGLAVCLASGSQLTEDVHSITPDGFGGVLVAWVDHRNSGTGADIYVQRILADGTIAPGWLVDGVPVSLEPSDQRFPVVLGDGGGGAFVTWDEEYESQPDVHVQRLAADGTIAPGWPMGGLAVCTASGLQAAGRLTGDGAEGVFIVWQDLRDGTAVYAHRATAAGQLYPGWSQNGISIVLNRYMRDVVSDGTGGAYLSSATFSGDFGAPDGAYYLQRFSGTGSIVPGWPDGGALLCQAPVGRVGLRMVPDGAGAVLLVWSDYRDDIDSDVYALRMRSDGSRDPSWPANGLAITENTALDDYADLAPDGQGGAYLCWDQYSLAAGDQVLIQHVTGAGDVAPGWPVGGRIVPSGVVNAIPHIAADDAGGAIVVWCDLYGRARALRIAPDGPVAAVLSLVQAEAEPNLVRLAWFSPGASGLLATVERRSEASDWQPLGRAEGSGDGHLWFEDRTVVPGERYGYRLAYWNADALMHTPESWLDIPELIFAIRGLSPNPSRGDGMVSFSLPRAEPATLELFDLTGRLVFAREIGSLGAGVHQVKLSAAGRLPAGVYNIRLVQGVNLASARAVVLR